MDNLDNNTCLYLHIKPESKEVFYVGIGNSKRPHTKSGRSRWWRGVVDKYGYDVIILADNLSWDDACEKEIYLIDYYGRKNLGKGTLVNMTDGGDGTKGKIVSEETKAKMSAAKKGRKFSDEHKAKLSAANTGKIMSKEARAKISAAQKGNKSHLGNKHSAVTRAKISAAQKGRLPNSTKLTEGQVIEILIEIRENPYRGQGVALAKKYGVKIANISSIKHNWTWKYICRETLTIR
mgnify:FL=1